MLGPVLLNIFFNNIENGIECILSKFADGTKMGGAVYSLEGRNPNPERLTSGPTSFNKARYKILNVGQVDLHYQYRLGDEWIERSPMKDLAVLVNAKLDMILWMCTCRPQCQVYSGLHHKKHGQQVENEIVILVGEEDRKVRTGKDYEDEN
ncbi:rna-directed dna polymerase from mobile element jockey-like [Pitangus sulphuratus]|nr:rna-directed dna polymerase from mobile element jockey-like [Pitangus sulphuratus]